jgi:hypothetical protein
MPTDREHFRLSIFLDVFPARNLVDLPVPEIMLIHPSLIRLSVISLISESSKCASRGHKPIQEFSSFRAFRNLFSVGERHVRKF